MRAGEHVVPTPEYVAAFVHASGLSLRQIMQDTSTYWGPVEWAVERGTTELMRRAGISL